MKEIPLTQEKVALVDDDDYEWLTGYQWWAKAPYGRGKTFYSVSNFYVGGRIRAIQMQVLIVCPPPGFQVDHIDGDGLNNQKTNLRAATCRQNIIAKGITAQNSSGFKGVSRDGMGWRAQIGNDRNGIRSYLGAFADPRAAAAAYDAAAIERYGEFAKTNKMLGLL